MAPDIEGAFEVCHDWWQQSKLRVLDVEKRVYDLKLGYAGTFDARVRDGAQILVIDWKTSRAIRPEHHLQNIAYRHAAHGLKCPSDGGFLVRIPKGGGAKVEVAQCVTWLTIKHFAAVLRVWKVWRKLCGQPAR